MSTSRQHQLIQSTLENILRRSPLKYSAYSDDSEETDYYCVDGKSIKFWNIWPQSGPSLDSVVYTANQFLQPYGLFLSTHFYSAESEVLTNVRIPQRNGHEVRCKGYVKKRTSLLSLLVKPLPNEI